MTNEEAVKIISQYDVNFYWDEGEPISAEKLWDAFDMAIEALRKQDQALNEWCTDCKEYDREKHCCPRFNRVIKSAFEDATETNVGDTVYRKQAIDALKELTANGTNKGMVFGEDAVHRIEMLPSAESQIITCHDCMWNDGTAFCEMHIRDVTGKDFCSWGEAKK